MSTIDLNCDLGEGYPNDAALMPLISSANIACGYHAGDASTMRRTVALALEHGVAIGAHPGFDDKVNFGRVDIELSPEACYRLVQEQLALLQDVVRAEGGRIAHVKPHGALYNMAARDTGLARVIARAVRDFDARLILFGLSGSASVREAAALGLRTASEVFADRTYQPDGSLTPRSRPGALIEDTAQCCRQVWEMLSEGVVTAVGGARVPIRVDTICLHGDGAHAVRFADMLRDFLGKKGIQIRSPE